MDGDADETGTGEPSSPVCYGDVVESAYMWARRTVPDIRLKRIYDPAEPDDGTRVLVDGMWPRGVRKDDAKLDFWCRKAAPSTDLRKWFRHDPARFDVFARRYRAELAAVPDVLQPLLDAARSGRITLVFAARNREHNHAVVLREVLQEALSAG